MDLDYSGWKNLNGKWYFFKDGSMKKGWVQDGHAWYYLNDDGEMQKGWIKDGESEYFTSPRGIMQTGWIDDCGILYYANKNGVIQKEKTTIEGKEYNFSRDGKLNS
ncbi:hypothetical protein DVV91_14715 [Clostridium botulinum]|uniref:collagenolytic protease n=1 Tax=Clostridium botulinum TaxID=1491 RepID=UPI0007747E1F|nr:collagenolytic protease [Clostridium botulinum]MBN1043359.1 hypothetical protein [Clostridium botulinum]MBN1049890.1 hypothetical protein [Clostridium botulinum]MBN1075596.1 hypothetical protein [Clostridium botulinum]MBN1078867.1 hypothetical protein [Clostridium botulinum]MBY6915008.1 hypothetical protein [Clostridium botulinum]